MELKTFQENPNSIPPMMNYYFPMVPPSMPATSINTCSGYPPLPVLPRPPVPCYPPPASLGPIPLQNLVTTLAHAPVEQRRTILGNTLYPLVYQLEHVYAPKVTGMLLEMDTTEVLNLIESPNVLKVQVSKALEVLKESTVAAPQHGNSTGSSVGGTYTMPDDYKGASHRELLKERLRKKMYAEKEREKALEEELRKEILMEKDFCVPKVMPPNKQNESVLEEGSVSRPSGLLDNVVKEKMPIQRHPEAVMPKVVISVPQSAKGLPKPNGKVLPKNSSAKPTKEDLKCDLCQLSVYNLKAMDDHLHSKKHQAKAAKRKLEQEKLTNLPEEPKPNLKELPKIENANTTKQELRCALCEVSVSSAKTMEDHVRGKKHQLAAAKQESDQFMIRAEKVLALREDSSALLVKLEETIFALNSAQREVGALTLEKQRIQALLKENLKEVYKIKKQESEENAFF